MFFIFPAHKLFKLAVIILSGMPSNLLKHIVYMYPKLDISVFKKRLVSVRMVSDVVLSKHKQL